MVPERQKSSTTSFFSSTDKGRGQKDLEQVDHDRPEEGSHLPAQAFAHSFRHPSKFY